MTTTEIIILAVLLIIIFALVEVTIIFTKRIRKYGLMKGTLESFKTMYNILRGRKSEIL